MREWAAAADDDDDEEEESWFLAEGPVRVMDRSASGILSCAFLLFIPLFYRLRHVSANAEGIYVCYYFF